MATTGVVRHPRYLDHEAGPGHVESPDRLRVIYERLEQEDLRELFTQIDPRKASQEELAWNHTLEHIQRIAATARHPHWQLDPDTGTNEHSYEAACLAVGGVFSAMDSIMDGTVDNAFALVRPPGHHAEADRAMGFCLFNNVALGAHYARKVLGLEKVMIVDWDLHHGNGTQHSFYDDPAVLYLSTHQYPYYPGSGSADQTGGGPGKGFTVNIPLRPGAGDSDFAAIFNRVVAPVGKAFSPDFMIVSAGFDIYERDPLGGMEVTEKGFAYLARVLLEVADFCCDGRILFCLEGGYSLSGLRDGAVAVLKEMKGDTILSDDKIQELGQSKKGPSGLEAVLNIQKEFWPVS